MTDAHITGDPSSSHSQTGRTTSSSDTSSRISRNTSTSKSPKGKEKPKWLSQIKEWITTSEPSTQALKQHREDTFKKAGVSLKDPEAHARLHAPMGTIPDDAIKPSGPGPSPEEVARKGGKKRQKMENSYGGLWTGEPASQTNSSYSGSTFSFPGAK